jgi:hypothetical protein
MQIIPSLPPKAFPLSFEMQGHSTGLVNGTPVETGMGVGEKGEGIEFQGSRATRRGL